MELFDTLVHSLASKNLWPVTHAVWVPEVPLVTRIAP